MSEIAFSDKTNAGTVFFLGYGNVEFKRKFTNFWFCQITERENDVAQLMGRYLIEKIGLILVVVLGTQQIMRVSVVTDSTIMPRGNIVRPEFSCKIRKWSEFDLAIAKHVGIGRATFFVFLNEELEYVVHILLGEIDGIIRYADFVAHVLNVRPILLTRTATVGIGLLPVGHIKSDNVKTLLFEKSSGNGTIYTAGHTDDNSFFLITHSDNILASHRQYVKRSNYNLICLTTQPSFSLNLNSFIKDVASYSLSNVTAPFGLSQVIIANVPNC